MKTLKSLMKLPMAAALSFAASFWACSGDDPSQTVGVWEDEPVIAFEDDSSSSEELNSSSSLDNPESSETLDESSSSESPKSSETIDGSSSSKADGIHFPIRNGCVSDFDMHEVVSFVEAVPSGAPKKPLAKAVKFAPAATAETKSFAATLQENEKYGVLTAFTQKRVEVLEEQGLAHDSAWNRAIEELFAELGIDSLQADRNMPAYYLEYALFYLYGDGGNQLDANLVEDLADGKLESKNYCTVDMAYGELKDIAYDFMPIGCAYSEREIDDPTAIVQNIWRKCAGVPYCGKAKLGSFNKDSSLVCKEFVDYFKDVYTNWEVASPLDVETAGIPCDNNGKYIVSRENSSRSYVCDVEKGWDSTTTLKVEMADVPCETHGALFKSEMDPGAVYICRDSVKVVIHRWDSKYVLNAWDVAKPFEAEVVDVPCDKNGEIVKSTVAPDSSHICKDGVWGTATRMERETYENPCDEEGKRVESRELSGMYYVCHEGAWHEFNDVLCEDGSHYSTASEKDAKYKTNYACKDGKWYSNKNNPWEIPYELYFNPDIEYGSFTDPRDGRVYRTIEYRGVTWMAENLKYSGAPDAPVVDKSFCKSDDCENSGYYYTLEAAASVCPDGWELPTRVETEDLEHFDATEGVILIDRIIRSSGGYAALFSKLMSLGVGYEGTDVVGLSFTKTGVFNDDAYVNYDYQYLWFYASKALNDIELARITVYEVFTGNQFTSVLEDVKAPVRCIKK